MLKFREKYELMKVVKEIEDISYFIDMLQEEELYEEDSDWYAVIKEVDCENLKRLWDRLRKFERELLKVLEKRGELNKGSFLLLN